MCGCPRIILAIMLDLACGTYDGQLPEDICDTTGQCEVSLRQLRGEVKLQQDMDMWRQNESADAAMHADRVEAILDVYFKDINMTGRRIAEAIHNEQTWAECASVDWTQEALEFDSTGKLGEMRKRLGVDAYCAKKKTDVTCLAIEVLDPTGVVGFGVCSILRTVLTGSPHQQQQGTCGWVSSLGALSWAAPAQAIKMGMRLFWTGTMLKSIKTCANIYDLQPGLVPLVKGSAERVLCYKRCHTFEGWQPVQASGVTAMWTYALLSSIVEHPQGCPIPSAINVVYTDMEFEDPEAWQQFRQISDQGENQSIAMCKRLISPDCDIAWLDGRGDSVALERACKVVENGGVALTVVDGKPLSTASTKPSQPGIYVGDLLAKFGIGDKSNHVTYLQSCDPERDSYAIWTWGGPLYLTKENLIGSTTSPGQLLFATLLARKVHIFDD
ncbi:unnamed protein product [Symbiodinium necroappetens]|uniref:Uncharacterized protein n=1 Tax=Symbiodinium necroappetens TaxID=1628268 RepID=A0A813A367_9DINO|nr:unnamed protein product [Symbiodinium necroappetens]